MSIHSKLHYEHSFESDAAHVKNSLKIREMHRQMGEPGEACKASTTFPARNATFLLSCTRKAARTRLRTHMRVGRSPSERNGNVRMRPDSKS